MAKPVELFEVLVVDQAFQDRVGNFTMDDFREDKLPNHDEPNNVRYKCFYSIQQHRVGSSCPQGYTRWTTGKSGKLERFDKFYDSSG